MGGLASWKTRFECCHSLLRRAPEGSPREPSQDVLVGVHDARAVADAQPEVARASALDPPLSQSLRLKTEAQGGLVRGVQGRERVGQSDAEWFPKQFECQWILMMRSQDVDQNGGSDFANNHAAGNLFRCHLFYGVSINSKQYIANLNTGGIG